MNILLINEYYPESLQRELHGGVEARCFALASEIAKFHKVTVLSSRQFGQPKESVVGNVRVIRCGPRYTYTQSGAFFKRCFFVFAAVLRARTVHCDLVDGYNFLCYPAAWFVGFYKRIPRIATYHEVWVGEWQKHLGWVQGLVGEFVERITLWLPWDRFIAVSQFTAQRLHRNGIPEEKITIVHNGYDESFIKPLLTEKKNVEPTLIYIGRLVKHKRVDILLQAFCKIIAALPLSKLIIVGSGPEAKLLQRDVQMKGIAQHVLFTGYIASSLDVMKQLRQASVFCLPSEAEGFGIVAIEACAVGTPYIATNIPAITEITQNGKGGFLVRVGEVEEFTQRALQLLTQHSIYEQKVVAARQLAQHYTWDRLGVQVKQIYESLS